MRTARAFAKINLGLVVGPVRPDGKHEVVTVLERIDLADTIEVAAVAPADGIVVEGYADTVVRAALARFVETARIDSGWHVRIEKRIPVAAGLGGGSSDSATALRLANEIGGRPLGAQGLHDLAASIGADVPFFLRDGSQLATADGSELTSVAVPHGVPVVLVLPEGVGKDSTAAVYERFDDRAGSAGFDVRRASLLAALERVVIASDVAALPRNDLVSSPLAADLEQLGAFRADVSGAGPTVYGLFEDKKAADAAARAMRAKGQTWRTWTVDGR